MQTSMYDSIHQERQNGDMISGKRTPSGKELPAMEVRNLHFSYGKTPVLTGVDLTIKQGAVTTIMGANGCGKSTLFALMTKNLTPDHGKIFLRGKNIANLNLKDYAKQVSIVQQYNSAADDITVERLVAFGRTPYQKMMSEQSEEDERIIEWAMKITNIAPYRDREISRLSGGQRQRVWIAMALAQNTKILFLDEPTTYLDIRYQIEILELVKKLNVRYGITIVMVLHDINQAIYYSDQIIGLAKGKVCVRGTPQEVITQESIRSLYGIRLKVTEIDGKKYVLLADKRRKIFPADCPKKTERPDDRAISDGSGISKAANGIEIPEDAEISQNAEISGTENEKEGMKYMKETDSREDANVDEVHRLSNRKVSRALWITLGLICLALGTIGVFIPILPTVPFYLVVLFSFAKGSDRLYNWFTGTRLYHEHLESFAQKKGMTWKTKFTIMGSVTVVMAFGFFMMKNVPVGRIVLTIVWIAHIIAFLFVIKTADPRDLQEQEESERNKNTE